jgi:hypothetical protein
LEGTEAFQLANAPQAPLAAACREARLLNRWVKPSPGWVKINWDAALDRAKGYICLGAIICDSAGNVLATHGITKEGFVDSTIAEALGAVFALQLGREMGLRRIQVEGDAKLIVEAINLGDGDGSMRGHLIADIRVVFWAFQA